MCFKEGDELVDERVVPESSMTVFYHLQHTRRSGSNRRCIGIDRERCGQLGAATYNNSESCNSRALGLRTPLYMSTYISIQ